MPGCHQLWKRCQQRDEQQSAHSIKRKDVAVPDQNQVNQADRQQYPEPPEQKAVRLAFARSVSLYGDPDPEQERKESKSLKLDQCAKEA